MSEWRTYRLGDVTDWYSGGTPSKAKKEFWNGDIPWISASSMHDTRLIDSDHKVTEEGLRNGTRLAKKDSVLLLVRGSTLHQRIPIGIAERDIAFNQDVKAIVSKCEDIDQWYLLYWFLSKEKELLAAVGHTGIGAGKLDTPFLQDLNISVPDEKLRKQITSTAKTLDDKIALNRKLNETLEEMARALFQSWFVDFDPVKAKLAAVRHGRDPDRACMAALSGKLRIPSGKPKPETLDEQLPSAEELDSAIAALDDLPTTTTESLAKIAAHFPSDFQESELGLIPEGWEVKPVSDFGKVVCGKTPTKKNKKFYGDEMPFLKIPDMHGQVFAITTNDKLSRDGGKSQQNKEIPPYSVCVSCIATVGKVAITCEPTHTNQQINSVVPSSKQSLYYLYFTFLDMEKELHDLASGGSATLNLNTGNFSKIIILKPAGSVIESFHQLVGNQFESIKLFQYQSQTLAKLRDTLLPKLLSGELTVGEAETKTKEALP